MWNIVINKIKKKEIDEIILVGESMSIPIIELLVYKYFNNKQLNIIYILTK